MIEVSGLSKTFGSVKALKDVAFTVEKGKIVGFLGANGTGKTTTMDIICGCIGADRGSAKIVGFDITEQPIEAKKRLGYLPDIPPLHPEMQVRDFISYAAKLHKVPSANIAARVDKTLDRLSLGEVQKRLVGNLSKGFRQRVALAQAIVHDPDVLVLDEPTEGLDPNQIVQIRDLIKSLAGEHTIILSSHILTEVQNTCEEIIIINKGQIVRQGTYQDLVDQLQTGRVYSLRVNNPSAGLRDQLSTLGGVQLFAPADRPDTLEFALSESVADVDQVAKLVVDGGFGLRELALKTKSLEDVFFEVTQ